MAERYAAEEPSIHFATMHPGTNINIDRWVDEQKDRWKDRWKDGEMDIDGYRWIQMDRWIDGQMDIWID